MRQHLPMLLLLLGPVAYAQPDVRPAVVDPSSAAHLETIVIDEAQARRRGWDVAATQEPLFVAQNDKPAPADPPPPPSMDDPGPEAVEPEAATAPVGGDGDIVTLRDAVPDAGEKVLPAARAEGTTPGDEVPVPEKIRPPDEIAPTVTIRTEGDVTVEEYRRDGSIYMVRVVPQRGIPYTYLDTDGDGRLEGDPKEGPMQPVYYTVYEWE